MAVNLAQPARMSNTASTSYLTACECALDDLQRVFRLFGGPVAEAGPEVAVRREEQVLQGGGGPHGDSRGWRLAHQLGHDVVSGSTVHGRGLESKDGGSRPGPR